jgi:2-hydroxy-6-oxonona-2,4-dienedioate hydrolase
MEQARAEIISYPAIAAGTLTRVLEAGSGDRLVLFVHGVGARADRWRRNIPAIADAGYRCLALDLPGHGFAFKGEGFAYGVPGYADFIESFMDAQGIDSAHFVGTSLGAHILGTVLCRKPSRARSFTLVGATGMFPIGEEARRNIADRITDTTREGIRRKLSSVLFDASQVTDCLVEEEWRINNSPGAAESFQMLATYLRERLDTDVIGEHLAANSLARRSHIVWGGDDRSVPLAIARKVEALLGAPLLVIPRAAHAPYWEASEVFNGDLLRFLGQFER